MTVGLTVTEEPDLRNAEGDLTSLEQRTEYSTITKKENHTVSEKVYIFDTTLRDAEQTPGAALNLAGKTGNSETSS